MTDLANIVRKEVKELLTPGSIASVLIMVVLFACLGNIIGGEVEKSTALPVIGVANYEDETIDTVSGEWNAYEALKNIYRKSVPPEDIDKYVIPMNKDTVYEDLTKSGANFALVLNDDFKESIESEKRGLIDIIYVYQPSGMINGTVSSTVGPMIVSSLNSDLSSMIIGSETEKEHVKFLTTPIDGSTAITYIKGEPHKDVTPSDISSQLTSQTMFIPIIIMIIIMMVGSIVISSMGSEKENKTLETLLTLPIKRTTIVTGKIIAAATVGLIFGLAYMLGMSFYLTSITSMSSVAGHSVDLNELGLGLGLADYALIAISMFLAIACALGICMILGAFAKNYKSAQTMTMPLSILAIIPMFITMFAGWYGANILIKSVLFIIPFSHPMMATEALMNGDLTLVLAGIIYMTVFALGSILITVRLYKSDILITGLGQNKYIEMLKGMGRRSKH
ncbi:MAG: ABC transporter permease [Thermoplasmata archaeon]|jgi:ABC-2 type transport system permease protein|nr:ABC transporter permease [Thermoplasmata archaeon]